jgi:hypothetical protein
MRWREIIENATVGATGSASIATTSVALGLGATKVGGIGVGFDPNGNQGIYQSKKKKPILLRR